MDSRQREIEQLNRQAANAERARAAKAKRRARMRLQEVKRFYVPHVNRGRTYEPNGERECARRRRQIAAEQLKVTG